MTNQPDDEPDLLPEYDFRNGIRGKYAAQFKSGSNVVVLDEDVAKIFPNSKSANRALRVLATLIQESQNSIDGVE